MFFNTFMAMIYPYRKRSGTKTLLCVVFLLFLFAVPVMSSAQEMSLFSFGKGKIQVRLYADYFCGPCRNLEPKVEFLITDLVKRNIITISFIDIPLHNYSTLYAKYFLYILNNRKNFDCALKARKTLFNASRIPLKNQEKLETFLRGNALDFKPFDVMPVFAVFQNYLQEDRVNSTPTCVIINGNKKDIFHGDMDVFKALEKLK